MYSDIAEAGFHYGSAFQWMQQVHATTVPDEMLVQLGQDNEASSGVVDGVLHPGLLDSCFHAGILSVAGDATPGSQLNVPRRIKRMVLWGALPAGGSNQWTSEVVGAQGEDVSGFESVLLKDEDGRLFVSMDSFESAPITASVLSRKFDNRTTLIV